VNVGVGDAGEIAERMGRADVEAGEPAAARGHAAAADAEQRFVGIGEAGLVGHAQANAMESVGQRHAEHLRRAEENRRTAGDVEPFVGDDVVARAGRGIGIE
jgi:hypothetical protein